MCGFHQGQRLYNASPQGRIYGSDILFVTSELYLASRGEPYMTLILLTLILPGRAFMLPILRAVYSPTASEVDLLGSAPPYIVPSLIIIDWMAPMEDLGVMVCPFSPRAFTVSGLSPSSIRISSGSH